VAANQKMREERMQLDLRKQAKVQNQVGTDSIQLDQEGVNPDQERRM